MTENKKWITPFLKQLLVVCGVSLNMANMGGVMGFPAVLLPQLRSPDSEIPIDNSAGSWIASIIGISLFVGNLMVPTLMGKFGRKIASLISCSILLVCWLWIALASDVTSLLIARFFQGLALGINLSLSPIMIGELTSPINRGVFTTIMSSMITADTLLVHVLGSYLTWQTTALVCAFVSCASLSILIFLPESPSWLADKGRYEDSAKAFKWLRGESEDEELEKMLEARKTRDAIIIGKTYEEDNRSCFDFVVKTLKKREFRKPVFIMIHLYTLSLWTGMPFLIVYTVDMLNLIVGPGIDVALHVTLLDLQRMISTIIGLIVVKKIKRRTILFSTVGVNLAALVALIIYMFVKTWCHLPFDHPAIGLILIHIHMCSVTTGVLPLPLVISGELFPLEFRSLAGGISGIAFSFNYFVTSKTAGFLQNNIGMYGTYLLYLFVAIYCSLVVWIHLPETKDRTLQDIEDEFKGKSKKDEVESAVTLPLKSEKGFDDEP